MLEVTDRMYCTNTWTLENITNGNIKRGFPPLMEMGIVTRITISGDVMHHIKELFGTYNGSGLGWNMSIPWNFKSQSQTWYGDLAKTILANL